MNTKKTILYIDDEEINLQLFKYNFSKIYEVLTECCAKNGLICLEKYPEIEVVISDMKMPAMNGLEFITKAREIYKDKKYFIFSGYDITNEIMEAIEKRLIIYYFRKPFNRVEIENTINQCFLV